MLFEVLALGGIIWVLYQLLLIPYSYWERKGYPFIEGSFPFGTKPNFIFSKVYQGYGIQNLYNKLAPHPFGGYYMFRTPQLLVRDPEVIRHIMIKDFSHFRSRFGKRNYKHDPFTQHLFNLEGDLWKSVRVKLTPTFSSGKLKLMYSLFESCSEQLQKILEAAVEGDGEIDIKDVFARFTTDVIATCAFGLEINSINHPDNEFRQIGKEIFPPFIRNIVKLRMLFFSFFPSIRTILRMTILPKKVDTFLKKVIKDTIEYRETNHVQRNDFLNLLLEIKNKELAAVKADQTGDDHQIEMDLGMIIAQCFIFFAAGFETSSSVQSYALYELALNTEIQNKLQEEIDRVLEKHDGKPTYQALQEMTYLEQVIFESIRKYPTVPILTRQCTKDYDAPEIQLKIEKGVNVVIPVYALHHDPKYFPEPEKFDPERFSEENKESIPHCAFLPFGEGPRLCIGMRFGMLQTKLGLVTVLSRLNVRPSPNTQIPLKFVASFIVTTAKGEILLKLEKRKREM